MVERKTLNLLVVSSNLARRIFQERLQKMIISNDGLFGDDGESLIRFNRTYYDHSLSSSYTDPKCTPTIREISGPLLIRGDLLVERSIVTLGDSNVLGNSNISLNSNENVVNDIESLRNDNYSQSSRISELENIVKLLCKKLSFDPDNIHEETNKLKNRTSIEKRLDAI